MKNEAVKKIVVGGAIAFSLIGMNGYEASAEWKQNKGNNTWNWVENNSKATGWRLIDGTWYYFDNNGAMHVGWLKDKDKWYKFNIDGSMITGWINDGGKWYYAKSSGDLETDMITINGKTYRFLNDGAMIENVQSKDSSKDNATSTNTSLPEKDSASSNSYGESKGNFKPRMSNPDLNDKHYYSNDNIFYNAKLCPPFTKQDGTPITGNGTWYAWGRTWEITGKRPISEGFTGNAHEWWQANISKNKYKYGSEPKVGALAVWNSSLPGSGGCGHIAVVEKIENGKVYISQSSWHGKCFDYREIYSTEYLDGYIYLNEPNY